MRKSLWIMLAVLLVAVAAPIAHADTFDVSGTAMAVQGQACGSNCPFSGTLTVDVTTGKVTAVDITLGLTEFKSLTLSGPAVGEWEIRVANAGSSEEIVLFFATAPSPGSLLGFTGGTNLSGIVAPLPSGSDLFTISPNSGGTITPAPEPSSVALILLGVGLVLLLGKRGHQLAT